MAFSSLTPIALSSTLADKPIMTNPLTTGTSIHPAHDSLFPIPLARHETVVRTYGAGDLLELTDHSGKTGNLHGTAELAALWEANKAGFQMRWRAMEEACGSLFPGNDEGSTLAGISVVFTADTGKLPFDPHTGNVAVSAIVRDSRTLVLHPVFLELPACLQFKILVHETVSHLKEGLSGDVARQRTARFLDGMCGYFDTAAREYVIVTPNTPVPWINYLGVEGGLSAIISQTSGGTAWFGDSLKHRILRYHQIGSAENTPGRYLYVRDNRTGEIFSPTCDPVPHPFPDAYECRHGLGYTRIRSVSCGIYFDMVFFIPQGECVEIQSVTLTELRGEDRDLSLFAYREFVNCDVLDEVVRPAIRNYTVHVKSDAQRAIIYNLTGRSLNNPRQPIYYFASTVPTSGFDTDYREFLGGGRLSCPEAVERGRCLNSISHTNTALGVHQIDLRLSPGTEEHVGFLLGVVQQPVVDSSAVEPNEASRREAESACRHWAENPRHTVENALAELEQHFSQMLGVFQCRLPSTAHGMELMVNTWNGYGVWLNFLHSRSVSDHASGISRPALGTRDTAQDLYGLTQLSPSAVRKRILDWFSFAQMPTGACYHHFNPRNGGNDGVTGYSDDHLWIVMAIDIYIKETGDFSLLDEPVGYADNPQRTESVFQHLLQAIRYSMENPGLHGIPLMMTADWNNVFAASYEKNTAEAGRRAKAESVMVGMMVVKMAKDLLALAGEHRKRSTESRRTTLYADAMPFLRDAIARVTEAINQGAWCQTPEGEGWYAMGSDMDGAFFGTPHDKEGRIFLLPQAWALLSGVADPEKSEKLVNAIRKYLSHDRCGLLLLAPSYRQTPPLGSFNVYPPGSRENGGTFCHAHAMAFAGLAKTREGDWVYELYQALLPPVASNKLKPRFYSGPPYAYSQFRYGPDHPLHGQAKGSWLTGTSAWSYYGACQWLLGIRPEFDGLSVDPCIPGNWPGFSVTRKFRGGVYEIDVINGSQASRDASFIEVEGKRISGNTIPFLGEGTHRVTVHL